MPGFSQLLILYLFSGPSSLADENSLASLARCAGHIVEGHDILTDPPSDLASDVEWSAIERRIDEEKYDAYLGSPPCRSFSRARANSKAAKRKKLPRPLRDATGPGLYGRADLTPD